MSEVLQQQPHGRIRILAAGQVRGTQAAPVGVVLVQPDQQLGVHPSNELLGR